MIERLFLFNPDLEMAIANGGLYYTPPARIVRMSRELAYLPAYFSKEGDGILLPFIPDAGFVKSRREWFGLHPRIVLREKWQEEQVRQIEPWGWTPRESHYFKRQEVWDDNRKELYSRKTALRMLNELGKELDFVDRETVLPVICYSLEEVKKCLREGDYLLKAPWSSSGRGILPLSSGGLSGKSQEWVKGVLQRQNYVMVEKRLDRVCDFAMEFRIDAGAKVNFLGLSEFSTGKEGEYKGNRLGSQEVIRKEPERYVGSEILTFVQRELQRLLGILIAPYYEGYLGVDMMIYREKTGIYKVQPCVEINLRYNMGILALFLSERYLAAGSEGEFFITHRKGPSETFRCHRDLLQTHPPVFREGKLVKGYVHLTPVNPDTAFLAGMKVRPGY